MTSTHADVFVGREAELGELRRQLAAARSGAGRLVVLAGEPGAGKTRLARELSAQARAAGWTVAWGSCEYDQRAPVGWPWSEVLSTCLATASDTTAQELAGSGGLIDDLLPGVVTASATAAANRGQTDQYRSYHAVASLLQTLSQATPILLVIDDLQWADETTLRLLAFVQRRIADQRLMILTLCRSEGGTLMGRLVPAAALTLDGLAEPAIREYLRAALGDRSARRHAVSITRRTGGNPLFVSELARLLASAGDDRGVPAAVEQTIMARMQLLPPNTRRLLPVAAVIGTSFDLALLASVARRRPVRVAERLAPAVAAGMLLREGDAHGFNHGLVAEVLAANVPAPRRQRLHAQITRHLAKRHIGSLDRVATELAFHAERGRAHLPATEVVGHCLRAGQLALRAHAGARARDWFDVARREHSGKRDQTYAAIAEGLGSALFACPDGDRDAGIELLIDAVELYVALGRRADAVRVACQHKYRGPPSDRQAELFRRASELVPERSIEYVQMTLSRGLTLYYDAHALQQGRDAVRRGCQLAEQLGAPDARHAALEARRWIELQELDYGALLDTCQRGMELDFTSGPEWRPRQRKPFASTAGIGELAVGDAERAHRLLETGHAVVTTWGSDDYIDDSLWLLSFHALVVGDWASCGNNQRVDSGLEPGVLDLVPAGLAALETDPHSAPGLADTLVTAALELEAAAAVAQHYRIGMLTLAAGYVWARTESTSSYRAPAARLAALVAHDAVALPADRLRAMAALGLIAVARSDVAVAERTYAALLPWAGSMMFEIMRFPDPILGQLAHLLGDVAAAERHLHKSIGILTRQQAAPECAWARYELARMLLERRTAADTKRAAELLDLARASATTFDMDLLAGKAAELAHGVAPQPGAYGAGALSKRELEVLQLIAQGLRNEQIAEQLSIAERTVANHATRIYAKLGVPGRVAAGIFAVEHGLTARAPRSGGAPPELTSQQTDGGADACRPRGSS